MTFPRLGSISAATFPSTPLLALAVFIISLAALSTVSEARPKRQYESCSYKSKNVIKSVKTKRYKDLKSCTVRNAALDQVKTMNWFYEKFLVPSYKKQYNQLIQKMIRKNPKKRTLLKRRKLARISLTSKLVSVKGKIIRRSRKNCRIKITKMVIQIKSCGIHKIR